MRQGDGAVVAVAGLCVGLHMVFAALAAVPGWQTAGLWLRGYLAFYGGVLHGGDFLYPGQRLGMLLTHGWVHVGWLHLGVNMAMLLPLGAMVVRRVGVWRFLGLYLVVMAAAAVAYGMATGADGRMVGASGAIHGLAGAVVAWAVQDRRWGRAGVLLAALAAANAWFWWLTGGSFAWELHLAGLALGAALAPFVAKGAAPAPSGG